jgi:hypothetical protein
MQRQEISSPRDGIASKAGHGPVSLKLPPSSPINAPSPPSACPPVHSLPHFLTTPMEPSPAVFGAGGSSSLKDGQEAVRRLRGQGLALMDSEKYGAARLHFEAALRQLFHLHAFSSRWNFCQDGQRATCSSIAPSLLPTPTVPQHSAGLVLQAWPLSAPMQSSPRAAHRHHPPPFPPSPACMDTDRALWLSCSRPLAACYYHLTSYPDIKALCAVSWRVLGVEEGTRDLPPSLKADLASLLCWRAKAAVAEQEMEGGPPGAGGGGPGGGGGGGGGGRENTGKAKTLVVGVRPARPPRRPPRFGRGPPAASHREGGTS